MEKIRLIFWNTAWRKYDISGKNLRRVERRKNRKEDVRNKGIWGMKDLNKSIFL
jgi:hypothetical protein